MCGGGIGGLTYAAAARRRGASVVVLERSGRLVQPTNHGSGLGLWPPALHAMASVSHDLLSRLECRGRYMALPSYADGYGRVLAAPSPHFPTRFPVLCLRRDDLLNALSQHCIETGVNIQCGEEVTDLSHNRSAPVEVVCASGRSYVGDFVVGADGLHSRVRPAMAAGLAKDAVPPPQPVHCGYVYFRANVCLPDPSWHARAFEAWQGGLRFGMVPLRYPEVFWFASVPLGREGEWPADTSRGAHTIDDSSRETLIRAFSTWRAPSGEPIAALLHAAHAETILRTDIWKLPAVTRFPWRSADGRTFLLGDACHATAPNLAQGAGLAIEDALDLAALLFPRPIDRESRAQGAPAPTATAASAYETARKGRAAAVQRMADLVAAAGHANGVQASVRDAAMRAASSTLPKSTARIFELAVSHSLGGRSPPGGLHWLPPPQPQSSLQSDSPSLSCPLAVVGGWSLFRGLPHHIQRFRSESATAPRGGRGTVTVLPAGTLWRRMLGLPGTMSSAPFAASVVPSPASGNSSSTGDSVNLRQRWSRTFGAGDDSVVYSTTHAVARCVGASTGWVLLESVGGPLDSILSFGYGVTARAATGAALAGASALASDGAALSSGVSYDSLGVWLGGRWRIPLPAALLPQSSWTEAPTPAGWDFEGVIRLPAVFGGGTVMHYSGSFCCDASVKTPSL